MATILTYNGLTLSDIKTKTFDQKPIYTDDGVEYLYDQYNISVAAVFAEGLDPGLPGESAAQTYAAIQGCLSKPRQKLIYSENGTVLLASPSAGETSDAKNGPMPMGLSVKQISPGSYLVEFSIMTWIYNCCEKEKPTQPYKAHRWSESVDIADQDFRSVVTRRGRLSFTSDALKGASPDTLRNFITIKCPLRPRCLRKSSYTVTSDGLNIDYTITDTEQFAMPLVGSTKFEAEYRQVNFKSSLVQSEMIVRVWGSNTTSKSTLFGVAVTLLIARLAYKTASFIGDAMPIAAGGRGTFLMGGYSLDRLHENYVEMSMKLMATAPVNLSFYGLTVPGGAGAGAAPSAVDPNPRDFAPVTIVAGGVLPVTASATPQPDPKTYATLGLVLAQPLFDDPCLDTALGLQGLLIQVKSNNDTPQGQSNPATITTVTSLPTTTNNLVASEGENGCYIQSVIDINYETDQHIVQMPVAYSLSTAASFAYLAQPTMKKVVNYTIEKSGQQPTLPATISNDDNEILLSSEIIPNAAALEADNFQVTWKVAGRYVYGIVDPAKATLYAGRNPMVGINYTNTALNTQNFVSGLTSIDNQQSNGYMAQLTASP